jgi:UDP-glucose 4-epimerase
MAALRGLIHSAPLRFDGCQNSGANTTMKEFRLPFEESRLPAHVFITGGAGFLGGHFVKSLLRTASRVTVLDDFSTGLQRNLPASANLRCVHGTVLDRRAVATAASDADLVLHLASVVGMRRAHADPSYAFRVSDEGTANVLAMTRQPILLMSSSSVYGLQSRELACETDEISYARTLEYDGGHPGYACGKGALERHGLAAMASGRPVMIVRPFNVVGACQRSDFGMVLPTFVQRARARVPLEIHDDGRQLRSFGCVYTFIDCVSRLLQSGDAWKPGATPVNIGNPVSTSMLTLAQVVLEETGSDSSLEMIPYERVFPGKKDVRHRHPDCSRLERLIGCVQWPDVRSVVRHFLRESETPVQAAQMAQTA